MVGFIDGTVEELLDAGFRPRINKIKTILYSEMKLKKIEKGKTLPPLTPPYKGGGEERQFEIKAGVLQDKASKVEA